MGTLSSFRNRLLTCLAGAVLLATSGVAASAPSGLPQNAALVYYQACLFRRQFLEPPERFYGVVSTTFEPDSDPNATIKSFVQSRDYQFLVELITAASKLPQCDWGLVRRQWLNLPWQVLSPVSDLTHFLVVQAKVSACDGRYRAALENALTMRRIARHFGDETLHMYIQAEGTNARGFDLIRYVLGKMPPDAETLTWLQEELAGDGEVEWRPREALTKWLDWEVQCLQTSPDVLASWTRDFAPRKKTKGLTPARALARARRAWEEVFESALAILESEKPPQDKSRALHQLASEVSLKIAGGKPLLQILESEKSLEDRKREMLEWRDKRVPDPMLLMGSLTAAVDLYSHLGHMRASVHAAQAAITLYHIKALTGQLPPTLLEGLPKDPYTGKDFEYQVTERGFILRCRSTFIYEQSAKPRQFEFQVAEGAN